MKALLKLALLLAFCSPIFGQATSSITAQIVDSDGTPWVGGNYTITLIPSQAGTPTRKDNGQNVSPTSFSGTMDGTGSLAVTLVSASNINPKGSTWQFRVCPNVSGATCGTTNIAVNSSGSYSTQLNAVITAPRISGGLGAYAYSDVEVAATPNNSYWNVTSPAACRYYGSSWGTCGTGGGGPPTGAAGGGLSGTYPNPGFSSSALDTLNGTSSTQLPALTFPRVYNPNTTTASYLPQTAYAFNVSPYLLPHWTACTAKVRNNTGNCRVYAIGDSTTFGAYSTGAGDTGDLTVASYPTRLSQYLNASGLPVQRDSFMGGGNGTQSVVANDERVSVGSWSTVQGFTTYASTGGGELCVSGTGAGMSFTPTDPVNSFTIWYPTSPGYGVVSYNVDGGTASTFSENSANNLTSTVVSTTLGAHTLNISWSSGTRLCIVGVEASNTVVGAVQVINAGWSSATSANWAQNATAWNPLNSVPVQAPDLILLNLGINDWSTSVSVATYTANMQALITAYAAASDVVLVTPAPSSISDVSLATQQQYVAALYQLAITNNLPIIDNFSRWGSYERTNPAPFLYYSQLEHPSANGYSDFAEAIAWQLTSAVGPAGTNTAATNAANTFSAAQTAPGFFLQSKAAGPYSTFFDDFYTFANINSAAIGSASGNSCTSATTYTDQNHPGNLLLTSGTGGTGTGDYCGIAATGTAPVVTIDSSLPWAWETAVYVPVLPGTTVGAYQAGMNASSPAHNPWQAGMGFYLSSANGVPNDWYCLYGASPQLVDSGVAATVAWTRLTMVNDGTNMRWFIGGAQVCTTAIANITATNQIAGVWTATALSGTSVTMAVDYIDFQRVVSR